MGHDAPRGNNRSRNRRLARQLAHEEPPKDEKASPDDEDEVRSRRTINKIVTQHHSVLQHAVRHHGLQQNVAAEVERLEESYDAARFDFYSPEEIELIVATATTGGHRDPSRPAVSETEQALREAEDRQDAIIYLTAALTGLRRGELLTLLHWEDVDFEQSSIRVWETYRAKPVRGRRTAKARKPKSRKSRTVPMVEKVASALKELRGRGPLSVNVW
ncbi:MAG: tyrosine-type recombinase/integrase [Solirubrobacteraceae bacterium]